MLSELSTVLHRLDTLVARLKSHTTTQEEGKSLLQDECNQMEDCKLYFGVIVCSTLVQTDPRDLEWSVDLVRAQVASIHEKFASIALDAASNLPHAQRNLAKCHRLMRDPSFGLLRKALEVHPVSERAIN